VATRTCGTMTISLPPAMLARIEQARLLEDRTRSEFVRQAIRVYLAHNATEGRFQMGSSDGAVDKAKGRVKEAAGALTDDDELRKEGKLDQAVGKVKDAAGRVADKVRDAIKDARDRI
jgi:uncharacterized protein YjbJ (UPF0337 family)